MKPSSIRHALGISIGVAPIALILVGATRWTSGAATVRYNSEEHRLIVDRGIAAVVIPASVHFPRGIAVKQIAAATYHDEIHKAKVLAVGENPDSKEGATQDLCYWTNYAQMAENKQIYEAANSQLPTNVLMVSAYASRLASDAFSMGQLAALYGDYRRTTYCDDAGRCFLTDADTTKLSFVGGPIRTGSALYAKYCPPPMDLTAYLKAIADGVIPPYGKAGNATGNSDHTDVAYNDAGWWGDEMLRIATTNDWHFANGAVAWYVGMHRLALVYADSARQDPKYWNKALHYEANALHSLTDLFALGHVLTNRDETSWKIMSAASLTNRPAYRWMYNVIRIGGGTRDTAGRIGLSSTLPRIVDTAAARNDFLPSYPLPGQGGVVLAGRAVAEKDYHAEFNTTGAEVRNFNGDDFYIYGDAGLRTTLMTGKAMDVLTTAVTHSVQALFDAHVALQKGDSIAAIGSAGSVYFAALKYLPVYVAKDKNNYVPGYWARYAKAVKEISGATNALNKWDSCQVPYFYGKDWKYPPPRTSPCATF